MRQPGILDKMRSRQEMVVTTPLLETKFYVPRSRRGLVPRPRLSERLDRGAASKLMLVSAPAGFGKTTLLAEWLVTWPPGRLVSGPPHGCRSTSGTTIPRPSGPTCDRRAADGGTRGRREALLSLLQSPQPPRSKRC